MKKLITPWFLVSMFGFFFIACKKETKETDNLQDEISPAVLAQIKDLGFQTAGAKKIKEGYLVEEDILLTNEDLASAPNSPEIIYANEEHYRTFNLVNPAKFPVIKVALWVKPPFDCSDAFSRALDEAIRRYNAETLTIRFQRVTSGAHINIYGFYQHSNLLGFASFPQSWGAPGPVVYMNIARFSPSLHSTNINFISTVMAHEFGHCIGFRHTDFMNRAYSCGGPAFPEGQAGVGAIHIPGTPVGPSPNSWMLACIGFLQNRLFTPADKVALKTVY